jgi:hypothetical protein
MNREPWELTADLLRLRRWAVQTLTGTSTTLPPVDDKTLDLFLRLERCAAPLAENIGTDINPVLGAAAARETQSYLQAQVDGRALEHIAAGETTPIIVLKGGVHALRRAKPILPLSDIDVLVPKASVERIVSLLESHDLGQRAMPTTRHTALNAEDRLSVEVHWSLEDDGRDASPEIFARARPLADGTALRRLNGADHLLHVLKHAVLFHGNQSVSLRDAIVIGRAATDCSSDEMQTVREEMSRNAARNHLEEHLDFSIALVGGRAVDDPFINDCAMSYAAAAIGPELPGAIRSQSAVAFAVERELAHVSWAWSLRNARSFIGTGIGSLSELAKHSPGIARAVVGPAHVVYHNVVALFVRPMLRSTARRALASLQ